MSDKLLKVLNEEELKLCTSMKKVIKSIMCYWR
jgi:hypothetical protein